MYMLISAFLEKLILLFTLYSLFLALCSELFLFELYSKNPHFCIHGRLIGYQSVRDEF